MEKEEDALKEVQTVCLRAVKFLEDKLALMEEKVHRKFKHYDSVEEEVSSGSKLASSDRDDFKKELASQAKQILSVNQSLETVAFSESVEKLLEQKEIAAREKFSSVHNRINDIGESLRECQDRNGELSIWIDECNQKIKCIQDDNLKLHGRFQSLRESLNDIEKAQDSGKDELRQDLERMEDALGDRISQQQQSIDAFDQLFASYDSRNKRDVLKLKAALDEKCHLLTVKLSGEVDVAQKKMADILLKVESVEHLNEQAGSKVKIDDFIKQVRFNARQIEKINKSIYEDK